MFNPFNKLFVVADAVIEQIADAFPDYLRRLYADSDDPMLRGDRRAAAEKLWKPDDFPTNYADIPEDIRRPVVWDGRIIGGEKSVGWLGYQKWNDKILRRAVRISGQGALRSVFKVGLILIALYLVVSVVPLFFSPTATQKVAFLKEMGAWHLVAATYLVGFLDAAISALGSMTKLVLLGAVALPLAFVAVWYSSLTHTLAQWWETASEPYRIPTRDALLIWKHKTELRPIEYAAYCEEVALSQTYLKDQPVISIGAAQGVARARGLMAAPSKGQMVCVDGDSLRTHSLIFGSTGTGKTRLFIRPFMARFFKANWTGKVGAVIMDGKGTLWRDLLPLVDNRSDVVVLGTGEGQYGCDLLAGMEPRDVASAFTGVSGQVVGRGSDGFWTESASLKVMHSAAIAKILPVGHPFVVAKFGDVHPYSLMGIARLVNEDQLTIDCCEFIQKTLLVEQEVSPETRAEIMITLTWTLRSWLPMANDTKSGIVANVNTVLGKLSTAGELSRRFCKGNYERSIDMSHALNGGVVMIAVGESDWGTAGRIIAVWLKTRLFVLAQRRLQEDPEACRTTTVALCADEFQSLVTVGSDASDEKFWNIARETGLLLVAATQSYAALEQVIGREKTANICNLLRTKIILKTEETSTIKYMQDLIGTVPRGWEYADQFFATQGQREIAQRDLVAPRLVGKISWAPVVNIRFVAAAMQKIRNVDLRFVATDPTEGGSNAASQSSKAQAHWRQEQQQQEEIFRNLDYRPVLDMTDFLIGSGFAVVYVQRASGTKIDIVDLKTA